MGKFKTAINRLGIRHALVCPNNLRQSPETFGIQCCLDDGNHPGTRRYTHLNIKLYDRHWLHFLTSQNGDHHKLSVHHRTGVSLQFLMLELYYYKTIQRNEIIDLHNDISKPDLGWKNEKGGWGSSLSSLNWFMPARKCFDSRLYMYKDLTI